MGFYTGDIRVKGKIPGAKKGDDASGNWRFVLKDAEGQVVDKVVKKNKEGIRKGAWLWAPESGTYKAVVVFKGTYNGQEVKLRGSAEVTLEVPEFFEPEHEVIYEYKDGKHVVTASIFEGEHVMGEWMIGIFDMEGYPVVEPRFSDLMQEGKSFTAEFEDELEPGTYFVGAVYYGTVDGQPAGFIDDSTVFEVKEPGSEPQPGDGEDNGKEDGKEPVKPTEPKQVMDTVKNGGKMPKTATDYPLGMLVGGGILLLGLAALAILKLRRTAA
ncbi:hypothetical protein C8P63_1265 [Melghirimyces profundicolus]|uniref:LPXTG-motif cell wall-anchored protein n=1 Tax=Melghirimyces profundicolus TaxID=1242148 RepID=A0A2T6BCC3_9BACL|nr:hypothetical protein [Melghirimyces profundicolus]PTX53719.1 hypothetical protein C8P63_1265 [Melghirimyces profundicolus]